MRGAKIALLSVFAVLGFLLASAASGRGLAPFTTTSTTTTTAPLVPYKDNLYAASYGAKGLTHFSIGSDGSLQYGEFDVTGDPGPWNVAMTPDGQHLYVANSGGSDISLFDVQSDGTVTQPSANFADLGVFRPSGIAVSPDGKNLYVSDHGAGTTSSVAQFFIAADGSLSGDPDNTYNEVGTGSGPSGIAVSPDGASVYVTLDTHDQVEMYDRSPVDGELTAKATEFVDTFGSEPDWIGLTPDGKYAYVANYNDSTIVGYSVGADGVLQPLAQGPVATGYGVIQLAISPDGGSLYAAANCDDTSTANCVGDVWEYTIDPATGELATKTGSPYILQGNASNLWLSANGTSLYVSTAKGFPVTQSLIEQFDVAPDGTIAPKAAPAAQADNDPTGVVIPPDQGPTAAFTAAPAAPGSATSFDASASSDVDGTIAEYDWAFGDGTSAIDGGPTPQHTYAQAGAYTVTLHVTDDAGCSTATVFTGQTAYCNGNPAAELAASVTIGTGGTTTTATTATTSTTATTTQTIPTTTTATAPPATSTQSSPPPTTTATPPPPTTTGTPPPFGDLKLGEFAVARSAAMKHSLWLNAASAIPALSVANAVKYQWSISGPQVNWTWDCGGAAAAMSMALPTAGIYTVGLQVTMVSGQVGQTQQRLSVTAAEVSNDVRFPVFDCEDPGANEQPDRSDCVKSFSFGIVDVNSQGRTDDCFTITARLRAGLTLTPHKIVPRRLAAYQSPYYVYEAAIKGPILLNGLYVPLPESFTSHYDSGNQTIGAGSFPVKFGSFKTLDVPLNLTVKPDKFGAFHLGDIPLGAGLKVFGGLDLDAKVSLDLVYRATKVTFHVELPKIFTDADAKRAQGDFVVILRNGQPFTVDGGQLGPTDVFLGPLQVKGLFFKYSAADNAWSGGANVWLPGAPIGIDATPPPPDKGFGMKNGAFDHAGIGVTFPEGAEPPVFPGLFLKHMDVAIGVNPLRFEGSVGFSAAHVADIDGEVFVAFASPDDPYQVPDQAGDLQPLSGRVFDQFTMAVGGQVSLRIPVIDYDLALYNAYLLYEYPALFEFSGGFNFDEGALHIDGGAKGFLDGSSGRWSTQAGVHACLSSMKVLGISVKFCDTVGAAISSKGFGFCTTFPFPVPPFGIVVPVDFGIGYDWGGSITPMVFSCDYTPWAESVPGASLFSVGAVGAQPITLPAGLPSAMIRLQSDLVAPDATITAPDGTTFSTASMPSDPNVEVVQLGDEPATFIAIKHPQGGTWTIAPSGAAPLTGVSTSSGLPAPKVSGSVTGRGTARVLHYRLTTAAGRSVTFVERGPHTYHVIGTTSHASGAIAFRPSGGQGGKRTVVAQVVQAGAPRTTIGVATFRAPSPPKLRRPAGLRVGRDSRVVVARWRAVPGAASYATTLLVGGIERRLVITRGTTVRLPDLTGGTRAVVTVRAISGDGRRGPTARAALRAHR